MKIFYMNIEEINAILVIINECGSFILRSSTKRVKMPLQIMISY